MTEETLRQAFKQLLAEEERHNETAIMYYPHIERWLKEANSIPSRTMKRLVALLNQEPK